MKIQLLAFFVISAIVSTVQAETSGRGTQLDRRIQTATYSPDNVFRINASVGRATIVQFEDGETIRRDNGIMAMGDPSAWEVGPNKSGDAVTVKPKTDQEPDTNFIIKTNKRTYVLELKLVKDISKTTYLLRFNYPKPPEPGESPFVGRDLNQNPCSGNQNRRYEKKAILLSHLRKFGIMVLSHVCDSRRMRLARLSMKFYRMGLRHWLTRTPLTIYW